MLAISLAIVHLCICFQFPFDLCWGCVTGNGANVHIHLWRQEKTLFMPIIIKIAFVDNIMHHTIVQHKWSNPEWYKPIA